MLEVQIEVRYKETDAQGIVHHSNYAVWFEQARMRQLTQAGVDYKLVEEQGIFLVIRDLNVKFLKPVRFGDDVKVRVYVKECTPVKTIHTYEVIANGELCVTGETLAVSVSKHNMKPANFSKACPEFFKRLQASIN